MSERVTHTCATCGHQWQSVDLTTERHVLKGVQVNKQGPFCHVCLHLEMAYRAAELRGEFSTFLDVVTDWLNNATVSKRLVEEEGA